jgi:TQXA domain-containing protein
MKWRLHTGPLFYALKKEGRHLKMITRLQAMAGRLSRRKRMGAMAFVAMAAYIYIVFVASPAFAAQFTVNYYSSNSYVQFRQAHGGAIGTANPRYSIAGDVAYCMQSGVALPSSVNDSNAYAEGTDSAFVAAVTYGYPNTTYIGGYSLTADQARAATQLAIWAVDGADLSTATAIEHPAGDYVLAAAKALYAQATAAVAAPPGASGDTYTNSAAASLPANTLPATRPGNPDYKRIGPYYFPGGTSGEITVTGVDSYIGNADGTALNASSLPVNTDLYIYIPYYAFAGAKDISVALAKHYTVAAGVIHYPAADSQDIARSASPSSSGTARNSQSISLKGKLTIEKTSGTPGLTDGNSYASLAGAQYGVYSSLAAATGDVASRRIATLTTDVDGKAESGYVIPGEYWVKEMAAPPGYEVDGTVYYAAIAPEAAAPLGTRLGLQDAPVIGRLSLQKASALPSMTDGNDCYSLEGAEFGVYTKRENAETDTDRLYTLVTDADGKAGPVDLVVAGTRSEYFVKELAAPEGYALREDVLSIMVYPLAAAPAGATLNVSDRATNDPVGAWVHKVDAETGEPVDGDAVAQMGASLAGGEFTIRYYDGYYADVEEAEASGAPTRTWVIVTDEDGYSYLDEAHLKPGSDPLYLRSVGAINIVVIPLGTVITQETKAPTGYLLPTPNPFNIQKIEEEGERLEEVDAFNEYTQADYVQRGDFVLLKMVADPEGLTGPGVPEPGISFDVYAPAQYEGTPPLPKYGAAPLFTLATDAEGMATTAKHYVIENPDGTYTVRGRQPGDHGALPYGPYLVVQKNTTGGLGINRPFVMFVGEDGKTGYKVLNDGLDAAPIKIYKEDSETGKRVPATATWSIIDLSTGQPVEMIVWYPVETHFAEFISDENGELMLPEKLPVGAYELKEITAPAANGTGYLRNPSNVYFEINENREFDDPLIVTMKDAPAKGQVRIVKTDSEAGTPVRGATYEITAAADIYTLDGTLRAGKGDVVDTITTGWGGVATSVPLYLGNYLVRETATPPTHWLDDNVYQVGLAYEGQDVLVVNHTLNVKDDPAYVDIIKLDAYTGEALAGATLAVYPYTPSEGETAAKIKALMPKEGAEGQAEPPLYEWVSDGAPHRIGAMPPGKYTLRELAAPYGYLKGTEDVVFEVFATGESAAITMYNTPVRVEASKTDALTGGSLAGAEFAIYAYTPPMEDEDGGEDTEGKIEVPEGAEPLHTWTSDGTAKEFYASLAPGSYILCETAAPYGYVAMGPIAFTVEATGELQTLLLQNVPIQVEISKTDKVTGAYVPGAVLEIYGYMPTKDEAEAGIPEGAAPVYTWTSDGAPKEFYASLAPDEYILHEASAPGGYVTAEDIRFAVKEEGGVQRATMEDAPTTLLISKIEGESAPAPAKPKPKPRAAVQAATPEGPPTEEAPEEETPVKYTPRPIKKAPEPIVEEPASWWGSLPIAGKILFSLGAAILLAGATFIVIWLARKRKAK